MAVKIRLTRVGATKRPSYRVVATDSRTARDGRPLEIIGFYDPLTQPKTVRIDAERLQEWIRRGARPTEVVTRLMRQAGIGEDGSGTPVAATVEPTDAEAKPVRRRAPRKRAEA